MRNTLLGLLTVVGMTAPFSPTTANAEDAIVIRGRWLEQEEQKEAKDKSFKVAMKAKGNEKHFGWQTSDLAYDATRKVWWSVGDQNATLEDGSQQKPGGFLYKISPPLYPKVIAKPISIVWGENTKPKAATVTEKKLGIDATGAIDFEGIAIDPNNSQRLIALTEGTVPCLVEIQIDEEGNTANVSKLVPIETKNVNGYQANTSWEGIAIHPTTRDIYLSAEWKVENNPARIFKIPLKEFDDTKLTDNGFTPIVPSPVVSKGLDGALTGLVFFKFNKTEYLVVLERNTPKLYFLDPQDLKLVKEMSLNLQVRDDSNNPIPILSASPEGIALDPTVKNGLVIIGDPTKDANKDGKPFFSTTYPVPGSINEKLNGLVPLVFRVTIE